jgi:uncharacterized repeat protein (TIGR03803 family)
MQTSPEYGLSGLEEDHPPEASFLPKSARRLRIGAFKFIMRLKKPSIGTAALAIFTVIWLSISTNTFAQTEKVIHNFSFPNRPKDGNNPQAPLILDAAGNLYGNLGCALDQAVFGCGVVFELMPQADGGWKEKILHTFLRYGKDDGQRPFYGGLLFDSFGNLYGTTSAGGTGPCQGGDAGTTGCGVVFELMPKSLGWAMKIVHSFDWNFLGIDGQVPLGSVIFDDAGNLYGTTSQGGAGPDSAGFGTVFKLTPTSVGWSTKILHNFNHDGNVVPGTGLIVDAAGNLYGTTGSGGAYRSGAVFELMPKSAGWSEKILHSFGSDKDGAGPGGSLIFDAAGNLYGTSGGGAYGSGTVFELTPGVSGAWTETILHNFNHDGTDGVSPGTALTFDAAGNLYGTTFTGGLHGRGTVFKLTPAVSGVWTETILHNFPSGGTDGTNPMTGVIVDTSGNLYGTTPNGGVYYGGTVFEITP